MSISTPEESNSKKVVVETWGCQMNVADSEHLLGQLQEENYKVTLDPQDADLVLLNTCHIREKAKHKVMSRLGRLREIQKDNPKLKIAVAGCVAQAEGKKLLQQAQNIDILLGPGKLDQLVPLIHKNEESGRPEVALGFKDEENNQQAPALKSNSKSSPTLTGKNEISRFVNISQGCDNFCTFCVVPFTRGREISLHPDKVVQEVQNHVSAGAKEVTLLGQNVNSYGHDLASSKIIEPSDAGPFVDLLKSVADVEGLERLRFTTSNPHDFTLPLANLFKETPKLGRYLHLPVQSGNDEVLARMKRKVTSAEYLEKVQWLRQNDPDFAISTDIIVGFPGETEEQFQDTLKLMEQVQFSFVFAFKYSTRKGTAAARFKDHVAKDIQDRRLAELNKLQDDITVKQNLDEVGRQREVLFLYQSQKEPDVYYGRTQQFRLVRVKSGRNLVGQTLIATITEANKTALVGRLN